MKIPLSSPDITDQEINAVVEVLKTTTLSLGPKIKEFEENIAKYIGAKYAVAVNSGTSALHLAVKSLDISDGDEVITTPFSFIASSNCMLFERAKPIFVDIREDTMNIDETKMEKVLTSRTKAVLPVHVFGYPCEMDKLTKLTKDHGLAMIEDACEAIGAEYKGKKAGSFADCSVFAFYPNKQMTTGEGGVLVTDREDIYKLSSSLRNQGRDDGMKWLAHNRLGYNYRLSDINCALGIVQLSRIEEMLNKRVKVANLYKEALLEIPEIILPAEDSGHIKRSWFVYVVRLSPEFSEQQRDKIIEILKKNEIGCNNYFPPIHLEPFYVKQFGFKKGDFPVTESIASRTIALPFFNNLSPESVKYVAKVLKNAIQEVK
jgi:perosamine synthetase